MTAGSGYPNHKWSFREDRVVKDSGHDIDYLFYHLPLGGNFQIECDLVLPHQNPVAILVGGTYAGPLGGLDGLDNGTLRAAAAPIMFQSRLTDTPKPMQDTAPVIQQPGLSRFI